jgi:hypothetical protein
MNMLELATGETDCCVMGVAVVEMAIRFIPMSNWRALASSVFKLHNETSAPSCQILLPLTQFLTIQLIFIPTLFLSYFQFHCPGSRS